MTLLATPQLCAGMSKANDCQAFERPSLYWRGGEGNEAPVLGASLRIGALVRCAAADCFPQGERGELAWSCGCTTAILRSNRHKQPGAATPDVRRQSAVSRLGAVLAPQPAYDPTATSTQEQQRLTFADSQLA